MNLRSLVTFHDMGWWFQGNESLQYGFQYFSALHQLLWFLPTKWGHKLLQAIIDETRWGDELLDIKVGSSFESRSIRERHALLMAALWLLDEWPERFVRTARAAGVTQSRIIYGARLPYWFSAVLKKRLGHTGFLRDHEDPLRPTTQKSSL